MERGVAFGPAVPGLAPGAFMGAGKAIAGEGREPVRHKSPLRELGDCDVAHRLVTTGHELGRSSTPTGRSWWERRG